LVRPDGTKNALANETEIFLSHGFSCLFAAVSGAVSYSSVIGALLFSGAGAHGFWASFRAALWFDAGISRCL